MEQHPEHARLQELCDANDLDGILALVTLDELADAWWRQQRARVSENDDDLGPDSWTFDFFWIDGAYDDARIPMHRTLIDKLIERATFDEAGAVGVGPMENLGYDDPATLAWAEERSRTNDVFREALSCIWIAEHVSPATLLRLDAAAGQQLTRPSGESSPAWRRVERAQERLAELGGPKWYARIVDEPEFADADWLAALDELNAALEAASVEQSG